MYTARSLPLLRTAYEDVSSSLPAEAAARRAGEMREHGEHLSSKMLLGSWRSWYLSVNS